MPTFPLSEAQIDAAPFTFADLFAGIGGFHAALRAYGGQCRYAVEIDPAASRVYEQNWGHSPLGDVTKDANDDVMTIPKTTVLVAGFPCQSFSKSGAQRGMDEARGTLFWNVARAIEGQEPEDRPAVLILENVRNLYGPRHYHEWQVIVRTLRELGYRVSDEPSIMSPHWLPLERGGRPQVRERVFITATLDPENADQPVRPAITDRDLREGEEWDLERDLPLDPDHHATGCDLNEDERRWVTAWDEWVQIMWSLLGGPESGARIPGHPIWVEGWVHSDDLRIAPGTPPWKKVFLKKNSDLYTRYQGVFDEWVDRHGVRDFPPSRQKFEWQAQGTPRLWDCVMHFRPSGIRAKRPTYLPALVAITQTSIIGERERRITPREAARLQGLPEWFAFDGQQAAATYKQLGNGVNVGVVWHVLRKHVERDEERLKLIAPDLVHAVLTAPETPDDRLEAMGLGRSHQSA